MIGREKKIFMEKIIESKFKMPIHIFIKFIGFILLGIIIFIIGLNAFLNQKNDLSTVLFILSLFLLVSSVFLLLYCILAYKKSFFILAKDKIYGRYPTFVGKKEFSISLSSINSVTWEHYLFSSKLIVTFNGKNVEFSNLKLMKELYEKMNELI